MTDSADVVAGQDATATQYNNLRADAITRRRIYKFEVQGALVTGNEQGGHFVIENTETVISIKHKITSGTSATIRVQKNTSDVDAGITVGTSVAEETTITDPDLSENDILSLDITGVSGSPQDLLVQVITEYTKE